MIGSKVSIPTEHAFGSPEEIACRDKVAVDMPPTSFAQISPADNPSMNLAHADQAAADRSGSMKFSSF